jgi:hypothetical protein
VTATVRTGIEAYGEAGYRFAPRGAVFGRAFLNPHDRGAMAGVRWEF